MRTKKQFEELGFVFTTLGGGAISASFWYRDEKNEIQSVGSNAITLPTLRKRLEKIVKDNPNLFASNGK